MTYGQPYAFDYGGPPRLGPWQENYQPSAKEDTQFLSYFNTASSDLTLDVSQYETNLTDYGNYLLGGGSQFNIGSDGRTIEVRLLLNKQMHGAILGNTSGGTIRYEMRLASVSSEIYLISDNKRIMEIDLPSIPASDPPHEFSVQWASRPTTTDTGYTHELVVHNHTTNETTGSFAKDSSLGGGTGTFLVGRQLVDPPLNYFTDLDRIKKIRISNSYHNFSEFHLDNVETLETRQPLSKIQQNPLTMDKISGIGEAESFFGPVMQMAGNYHQSSSLALSSPLINEFWINAPEHSLNTTSNDTTGSLWRKMPGSGSNSEFSMLSTWARWVELPEHMNVNKFYWRVNAEHDKIPDVKIRFVAMNKLPDALPLVNPNDPPLSSFEMVWDEEDVPTLTQPFFVSGSSRIIREENGPLSHRNTAILCLAISGSLGGDSTLNGIKINSFQVWTGYEETKEGGLDIGLGG